MVDAELRAQTSEERAERAVLAADTRVGDYRIKGLVGEGAMGEVYLAQDLVLGRRVALKLLRREVAAQGGIARFLEEARATATFSHPHIVTLYAVGEHEARPYLALEFLDGESLRTRCAAGPLPEKDALRTARAIAEAIAEAHGRGVIHADLKPENVMVPRDGRVRVVDFGLARLTGSVAAGASGTPSYMAPERWTGATPAPAIDVWSIGVLLHELVTGQRPFSDATLAQLAFGRADPALPGLPDTGGASWAAVVRACLRRAPEQRPTADELVRSLTALLEPAAADAGGPAADADAPCPFPGLIAFGRDDRAQYFGRAAELDAIVEALRSRPLVPIIGPSGVGKSSFVSAAVIPRLEETDGWIIVTCRPRAAPFAALAAALERPELAGALREEPARLALALGEHAARGGKRVLLFVDQFEEVFTLAGDAAAPFCSALALAAMSDERWRIVLTVRDDFLVRLVEVPAMRPHLGAVQVLGAMTLDDLRAAVRGPLANVRHTTDIDALVDRIAADVAGQPASLALLQFACRALWERRDRGGRRLLTSAYEAMGGASGALATHAEHVLAELTPAQVREVRGLFLALVGPDGTRRPRTRASLTHLGDVGPLIEILLERRLLVVARQLDDDEPVIELAHEALATAWPRLTRWLDETHEERLLVAEVEQAASLWHKRGRLDEETWSGAALDEAVRKVDHWSIDLPSDSAAFLRAGVARSRRTRRRRRWLAGTIASVLLAITAAAVFAAIAFARSERRTLSQHAQIVLAAADMGRFELRLAPFDWDPATQRASSPAAPPPLTWRFRRPSPDDPQEPGPAYADGDDVRRGTPVWRDGVWLETVEARSGRVFLEVSRGPDCAPSILVLQRLPGYTERDRATSLTINVPTCAATRSTMVDIPAGPFFRNIDLPDDTTRDEELTLPAFAIDRTEVTRGAFAQYAAMKALTGDDAAPPRFLGKDTAPADDQPIVGINYATAASYCRYLGKTLPDIDQWQKAFRGGFERVPRDDPRARRTTVWFSTSEPRPANLYYAFPDLGALAPVASFPADTSPYGVVDLAGNVAEWTSVITDDPRYAGLRTVLGATWGSPPDSGQHLITWRNSKPDQTVEFGIGVRCVTR